MSQIIYPTIDLYLYDLRDGLGENPKTAVAENQTYFQAKLPPHIHNSLFDRDIDFEAEFVPLLGKAKIAPFPKNCASIERRGLLSGSYWRYLRVAAQLFCCQSQRTSTRQLPGITQNIYRPENQGATCHYWPNMDDFW